MIPKLSATVDHKFYINPDAKKKKTKGRNLIYLYDIFIHEHLKKMCIHTYIYHIQHLTYNINACIFRQARKLWRKVYT